jgi:hypothetical protein
MHPLDEATTLAGAAADPVRRGRTHDAYWTFIGPFGGASAATALRAVLEHPLREGAIRSRRRSTSARRSSVASSPSTSGLRARTARASTGKSSFARARATRWC